MWIGSLILGLTAGTISGLLGIGGGLILIPALVYCFGLTQHQAQGTTLAMMVPPIGLLAALKYYHEGNVKLNLAAFICLGFFVGALVGAMFVHKIPETLLRKIFGIVLFLASLKMIFGK
ncbi:MAG: sulfite exporter TauE/SafE family protein [Candidatus Omnitrophota bacterium]|nr:sulfite exporter TauE/SafE family protein [Candidatus Omnitrophota bacterium]